MKYCGTLIPVSNMEQSKDFYHNVIGLECTADYGENCSFGRINLQSMKSWKHFIEPNSVKIHSNNGELYFEEDNFDDFLERLDNFKNIKFVHPVKAHSWGQRVVRIFDPDGHIIEVGENIAFVARRFSVAGLTEEQIAKRMDVNIKYVKKWLS